MGSHGLLVRDYTPIKSKTLTDAATNARGVKECFWGFDHIAQVADHLGLDRPVAGSPGEGGWKAML